MYSAVGKHTQMLAFFFSPDCFSLLSVSPVWLPSRLLCSVVQFRMGLSFHIHFHSPSKSAPLIALTCIHSHNAETEKWTANWKYSVHLLFLNTSEVAYQIFGYMLWWIMILEMSKSLFWKLVMSVCSAIYLSAIKRLHWLFASLPH